MRYQVIRLNQYRDYLIIDTVEGGKQIAEFKNEEFAIIAACALNEVMDLAEKK